MYLIEILLPLSDNKNQAFDAKQFQYVEQQIIEKFGGLTAFTRAPAEGLWKEKKDEKPAQDNIVIFEVQVEVINKIWWQKFKSKLEDIFKQDKIMMRAQKVLML